MATLLDPDAHRVRTAALEERVRLLERRLATEHAIQQLLVETPQLERAARPLLANVAQLIHGELGELWLVDGDALAPVAIWCADMQRYSAFVQESLSRHFARGVGLPGRVWASAQATVIPDLSADANFPRQSSAALTGLRSAVAMPVAAGPQFLGVMEFFWSVPFVADSEMLQTLTAIGRDIAQAVCLQRQLDELERANRIKDEFLATLSHELRTPMNAILGWLRILSSGAMPRDQWDRAIKSIERNAKIQAQLIEDLLDISRIAEGSMGVSRQAMDLRDTVAGASETLATVAQAREVSMETSVPESTVPVVGDAQRLLQVVINLLSNAVKFTPRGGLVGVALTTEGREAVLTVRDTGVGIAADFLPHVFEAFAFEEKTVAREVGGLGLGLAISQRLVHLHDGTISAQSEGRGKGATFTVRLPLG
jgi:signal transduction histidine kinase